MSLLHFEKLGLQSTEDDSVDEEDENQAHTHYELEIERELTFERLWESVCEFTEYVEWLFKGLHFLKYH